jgi:transcriptional regulator with XRE-family HTH domain
MTDLRAFRKAHGLKAKDVADILGFSAEHISRCENGRRILSAVAWKLLECRFCDSDCRHD